MLLRELVFESLGIRIPGCLGGGTRSWLFVSTTRFSSLCMSAFLRLATIIHSSSTVSWASLFLCKSPPHQKGSQSPATLEFCQYNGISGTFFCVRVWCRSSTIVGLSLCVCWGLSPCPLRKSVCLLRILTRQARMLSTNILILAPSVSSFHHGK